MPFSNPAFTKAIVGILVTLIGLLLTVIGFFSAKTYASIERLSLEVSSLKYEIGKLESSRLTRQEVREIVADYHESHPQRRKDKYDE